MHRSLRRKPLLSSAAILLLVAATSWYFFVHSSRPGENPVHPDSTGVSSSVSTNSAEVVFPVDVAVAHRGNLVKRLSTTGTMRANREVEIVARTPGEIIFVSPHNGEFVKQGDILVRLDDREYRLASERASAGLLSAQIEYRNLSSSVFIEKPDTVALNQKKADAQEKFRNAELSFENGIVSGVQFARLKRDYETDLAVLSAQRSDIVATKSGLSQAIETYELAKLDLEATEIKAPFSGYVANCELSTGGRVAAQQVLLRLVDVSRLLVDVEVLESEISRIEVGRKTEVAVNAYPSVVFPGNVLRVNPIVDTKTKTVKVTVQLKDDGGSSSTGTLRLRPGMFATVKLETEILQSRVLVPKEALLIRDQRTLVFVAQSGLAKWQYVDVGDGNERLLEIQSGVSPGDTVLVAGHYTLAHDAKIRVQEIK